MNIKFLTNNILENVFLTENQCSDDEISIHLKCNITLIKDCICFFLLRIEVNGTSVKHHF